MRDSDSPPGGTPRAGQVIVVHGIFYVPLQFSVVRRTLRRAGFETSFIRYAGNRQRAAESVREIGAALDRLRPARGTPGGGNAPVHFVGYSLGALALRSALSARPELAGGRFVMIAPPNRGVGLLSRPLPGVAVRCVGPALEDLREDSEFVRSLPPAPPGSGIIAGDRAVTLMHPAWWFRHRRDPADRHDGTVEVRNTRLPDVPHVTVHHSHATICWSPAVADLVRSFLETGRFPASAAV